MRTVTRGRRSSTALLPLALAATLLAAPAVPATAADDPGSGSGHGSGQGQRPPASSVGPDLEGGAQDPTYAASAPVPGRAHRWTIHSSDGRVGPLARPLPAGRAVFDQWKIKSDWSYEMQPGLTFRRWFFEDYRGPLRAQSLRLDLDEPGLSLELLHNPLVPKRTSVGAMVARRNAVAGVNGDFFDIDDTGAPLGIGRDRWAGLMHAPDGDGWTKTFWLDADGDPHIGRPQLVAGIAQAPWLHVDNLNSPTVQRDGVGVYRPNWGWTMGSRVVDGKTKDVRQVIVRDGRVVANGTRLSNGMRIRDGLVLVGRGKGANRLRGLYPGKKVDVTWRLPEEARLAISGSVILRKDGEDNTIDNREMHPRTMVGINEAKNQVIIVVVDGRSSQSRGLTMKEASEMMRRHGCDFALNLDGGGSSTMVGERPNGTRTLLNAPSDGFQRSVANGLGIVTVPKAKQRR